MSTKEIPVTLTLQEIDQTLFPHLITELTKLYPDNHRQALRAAMNIADGVMAQFEVLAKRQSKSAAARAAAEVRWTPPGAENPTAVDAAVTPPDAPKKRHRRTKAEIAAAKAGAPVLAPAMSADPAGVYAAIAPVPAAPAPERPEPAFAPPAPPPMPASALPPLPPPSEFIPAPPGAVAQPFAPPPPAPMEIPTFGAPRA